MTPKAPTLRRILSILSAAICGTAIAVCALLIWSTHALRHANEVANINMMNIRLAEEARILLLLLAREHDPLVRDQTEIALVNKLGELGNYINSDPEKQVYAQAESAVSDYLDLLHNGEAPAGAPQRAYRALDGLAAVNLAHSGEASRAASRLGDVSTVVAAMVGGVLLLVVGGSLWLLRFRWLEPVFALAETIKRYDGDRAARAGDTGPAELRLIAQSFNELTAELARQSQRRMAFLAGVAHDLRNPLAALKMSTAMVDPDRPLPNEERIRQVMARVQKQIDRLDRMVWDFLDAARIESGNLEIRTESCDLKQLVAGVVELYRPTSPTHCIELHAPEESVPARCDPTRMEQVLGNLVSNAIRYSPKGGTVSVGVCRRADEVLLTVSDHGIGMNAAQMKHLFEPFQRAGREAIPGVGLGLFVARRIVQAHGGRIDVESAPGQGTTFIIHIPIDERVRELHAEPAQLH